MDETFPVPGMNTVRLILSLRKKCTGELDYGDQSRMFKNSKQKIFFSVFFSNDGYYCLLWKLFIPTI